MSDNNKNSAIITMIAQTHIHAGVGQSTGALDLPVARERTTHYPFVPGSGVKGAFRVWAQEQAGLTNPVITGLFGKEGAADDGSDGGAGNLLCSDARLLLLPVRCLSDSYKWVTCPAILRRFTNDCERADGSLAFPQLSTKLANGKYLGQGEENSWLGLEEREFQRADQVENTVVNVLAKIVDVAKSNLKERLVILSDKDFTWFARYALPVMARNVLSTDGKKKSENLWYEESLAPDTIMYVLFGERNPAVKTVTDAIGDTKYIQIGGNETIGQGWFKMQTYEGEAQ